MISLRRYGQSIALPDNFSIKVKWEYDIEDFFNLGSNYSWPITITREGNEDLFNFPHDPQNPDDQFLTYDGFEILFQGFTWFRVDFNLQEANEYYYRGTLTSIATELEDLINKNIREISTKTIAIDTATKAYDQYTLQDGVFFPVTAFHNRLLLANHSSSNLVVPWYSVKHLLRELLATISYNLIDDYTSDIWKQLSITSNEIPDDYNQSSYNLSYSQALPNMALKDLLKMVAILTKSSIVVDIFRKTVRIISYQTISNLKPAGEVDLIDLEVKGQLNRKNISFNYATDKDQFLQTFGIEPSGTDIQNITSYDTLSDFADVHDNREIVYIKDENAFYFVYNLATRPTETHWQYPDNKSVSTGSTEVIDLATDVIPVHRIKYTYKEYSVINLRNTVTDDAQFEIEEALANIPFTTTFDKIECKIVFGDQKTPLTFGFESIQSIAENMTDTEQLTITLNTRVPTVKISEVQKIVLRAESNMHLPLIGNEARIKNNTTAELPENNVTYIGFFTGEEATTDNANSYIGNLTDSSNTYQHATPNEFTPNGTVSGKVNLGTFSALSWYKINTGLLAIINNREVEADTYLLPNQIDDITEGLVFSHRGSKILLKEFDCNLTNRGIEKQILAGYLL